MLRGVGIALLALTGFEALALGQAASGSQGASVDDFRVYTEHPRLLLTQRRLKLLRRERDRQSLRWTQFELLMKGKAAVPEPAFSTALYSQILNDPAPCTNAFQAVSNGPAASDVRQVALVFDWCQAALN